MPKKSKPSGLPNLMLDERKRLRDAERSAGKGTTAAQEILVFLGGA
jgi:hypothetical protein